MELTPELFEKIEFAERRKGYDTEQVETFLEQAGTALAQMLARVRHTEERAAHAETRLAEAEQKLTQADQVLAEADRRVQQAERRLQEAAQQTVAPAPSRLDEDAEIEQAAKTLLMARRTAEATVNEAKGQAQSTLEDARARAERQLQEAHAEAEELLRRAGEQAEAEYADRRATALDEVQGLEGRRAQLTDVINQLESRLAGYRAELRRAAEDLVGLIDDPARLGARPNMSIQADQVLAAESGTGDAFEPELAAVVEPGQADLPVDDGDAHTAAPEPMGADETGPVDQVEPPAGMDAGTDSGSEQPVAEQPVMEQQPLVEQEPPAEQVDPRVATAPAAAESAAVEDDDAGERTEYLDLTAGPDTSQTVSASDRWGPGSWSELEPELEPELEEPTQAVPRQEAHRDRFMEELDSAVNEAVELDDDAMKAFFEGASDSRARRFGWRR